VWNSDLPKSMTVSITVTKPNGSASLSLVGSRILHRSGLSWLHTSGSQIKAERFGSDSHAGHLTTQAIVLPKPMHICDCASDPPQYHVSAITARSYPADSSSPNAAAIPPCCVLYLFARGASVRLVDPVTMRHLPFLICSAGAESPLQSALP
jgi:hypothetical protein